MKAGHHHSVSHHLDRNLRAVSVASLRSASEQGTLSGQSVRRWPIVCSAAPQGQVASCTKPHFSKLSRVFATFARARLSVTHSLRGRSDPTGSSSKGSGSASLLWSAMESFHRRDRKEVIGQRPSLATEVKLLRDVKRMGASS